MNAVDPSLRGGDPVRHAGASRRFGGRVMNAVDPSLRGGDPVRHAGASRRFGGRVMNELRSDAAERAR
jgi:hypothetical protein